MMKKRRALCTLLALIATTSPVMANVVWPALFLEASLLKWWVIGAGLLIEIPFVWWLFRVTAKLSVLGTLIANIASALAGIVLLPLAGVLWEIAVAPFYNTAFDWGTFNPATWAATFVLACLINAAIESFVLSRLFERAPRWREFLWLIVPNALSVALALAMLLADPPPDMP